MKAITLRGVPPDLVRFIRRKADQDKISLNKTVIRLLEEQTGRQKKTEPLYHDLDALAGAWTRKETREFERALKKQRGVEQDLWR